MLNQSQLDKINKLRLSYGKNPVTLEQAEIMIESMSEVDRARALVVIGMDEAMNHPKTCEERIAAAVSDVMERCAVIAENERVTKTGQEKDEYYNMACMHIAESIRNSR